MPFTFSHPGFVIPIYNKWSPYFSLTGLFFGSIIPDFEYFVCRIIEAKYTHFGHGIFSINIPAAFVMTFVFHYLIRNSLIYALPKPLTQMYVHHVEFEWFRYFKTNVMKVILSIILGVLTHIFLDALTHDTSILIKYIPGLGIKFSDVGAHPPGVYTVVQYVLSIIGLWIFIKYLLSISKKNPAISYSVWVSIFYWLIFISVTAYITFLKMQVVENVKEFTNVLTMVLAGLVGASIIAGITTSIIYIIFKTLKPQTKTQN